MPLLTEEREIDGVHFRVRQANLKEARAALVVITRSVGGLLSGLLKATTAEKLADLDTSALAGAVASFTEHLSDQDIEFLTKIYSKDCLAAVESKEDGAPAWVPLGNETVQATVFGGRLLLLFKWLWFAIEVNYADFLAVARTASTKLDLVRARSKSQSPTG